MASKKDQQKTVAIYRLKQQIQTEKEIIAERRAFLRQYRAEIKTLEENHKKSKALLKELKAQ